MEVAPSRRMPWVRRGSQSGVWVSDQQGAEKIPERMGITPEQCAGRLPFVRLSADPAQGFTNLPRQNNRGHGGTDEPEAKNYGRRLIYGSVDFVIGSLREISLGDRRNAYHGAQQEQNEHPDCSAHRGTSVGFNNNCTISGCQKIKWTVSYHWWEPLMALFAGSPR